MCIAEDGWLGEVWELCESTGWLLLSGMESMRGTYASFILWPLCDCHTLGCGWQECVLPLLSSGAACFPGPQSPYLVNGVKLPLGSYQSSLMGI